MNKTIKRRWVKSLRSGDFKQGLGTLKEKNRYCCLGVLAHILPQALKDKYGVIEDNRLSLDNGDHSHLFNTLPEALREEIGLGNASNDLIHMNDSEGKSFAEIADYIEENL